MAKVRAACGRQSVVSAQQAESNMFSCMRAVHFQLVSPLSILFTIFVSRIVDGLKYYCLAVVHFNDAQ